jgi:phenylalanyl-tRNA synthetase alpha chain
LHDYEYRVLSALSASKSLTVEQLSAFSKLPKDAVLWALENLSQSGSVSVRREDTAEAELSEEGRSYLEQFPEERVLAAVAKSGRVRISEIKDNIGLSWAKRNGWIALDKGFATATEAGKRTEASGAYRMREVLRLLSEDAGKAVASGREAVDALVKRGLVQLREKSVVSSVSITPGGVKMLTGEKADTRIGSLTKEIIGSGAWRDKGFRPYDVGVPTENVYMAKAHPLRQVINKIRSVYFGMGFREISGPIVEPAFWTFDNLFVPQDHPAREQQDTFYVKSPARMRVEQKEAVGRIRKAHQEAFRMDWSEETASQTIIRSHTTSTTGRYLYSALAGELPEESLPLKFFVVGRNFRNEAVDYKHLADFYQTDGMIIGKGLTLANLFDTLRKIYGPLGIKLRFRPVYYPFVEPGVGVQMYYEAKRAWVDMGGAGIIRREITGIARKNISVLAWGLGVERVLLSKDRSLGGISELYNSSIGWARYRMVVD